MCSTEGAENKKRKGNTGEANYRWHNCLPEPGWRFLQAGVGSSRRRHQSCGSSLGSLDCSQQFSQVGLVCYLLQLVLENLSPVCLAPC